MGKDIGTYTIDLDRLAIDLTALAGKMRSNSERWFPDLHKNIDYPMHVFYTMGFVGEAGEIANVVKKGMRKGEEPGPEIAHELADVFTYLLLLIDELGVDVIQAYVEKAEICEERWGTPKTLNDKFNALP